MNNTQKLNLLKKHFAGMKEIEATDSMMIHGILNQLGEKYIKIAYSMNVRFVSAIAGTMLKNEYGYTQSKLNKI
jgi:hypothetical protein